MRCHSQNIVPAPAAGNDPAYAYTGEPLKPACRLLRHALFVALDFHAVFVTDPVPRSWVARDVIEIEAEFSAVLLLGVVNVGRLDVGQQPAFRVNREDGHGFSQEVYVTVTRTDEPNLCVSRAGISTLIRWHIR